ncbi:hypothetical protein fugu_006787 [Takifugu bimaculatus]|uniref:Uncharacterized protein n=1 Tax=Takifugu bimaculatus TaxID=433685 RepID=A0A4Z2B344_9TELE|nr:hypothetical protein fugu_006787 [Takifugu bimaculatus]
MMPFWAGRTLKSIKAAATMFITRTSFMSILVLHQIHQQEMISATSATVCACLFQQQRRWRRLQRCSNDLGFNYRDPVLYWARPAGVALTIPLWSHIPSRYLSKNLFNCPLAARNHELCEIYEPGMEQSSPKHLFLLRLEENSGFTASCRRTQTRRR